MPSLSQSSVPSLPASLATVESKLSVPQSPPRSPVKSPLEVRLYPQPYFQNRTQHQAQQLKKIEPPLQSPVKLKPKVVSTALVRFVRQCFHFPSVRSSGSGMVGKHTQCGGTTGRHFGCLCWNCAGALTAQDMWSLWYSGHRLV